MYGRKNPPRREIDLGDKTLGAILDRQQGATSNNSASQPSVYEEPVMQSKSQPIEGSSYEDEEYLSEWQHIDSPQEQSSNSSGGKSPVLPIVFCICFLALCVTVGYVITHKPTPTPTPPAPVIVESKADPASSNVKESAEVSESTNSGDTTYTMTLKDPPFKITTESETMIAETVDIVQSMNILSTYVVDKKFTDEKYAMEYELFVDKLDKFTKAYENGDYDALDSGAKEYIEFIIEYSNCYKKAYKALGEMKDGYDENVFTETMKELQKSQLQYTKQIDKYLPMLIYYGLY